MLTCNVATRKWVESERNCNEPTLERVITIKKPHQRRPAERVALSIQLGSGEHHRYRLEMTTTTNPCDVILCRVFSMLKAPPSPFNIMNVCKTDVWMLDTANIITDRWFGLQRSLVKVRSQLL